jgi:hypothetical protein
VGTGTAFFRTVLLVGPCFIACSRDHSPRLRLVGDGISRDVQTTLVARDFFGSPEVKPYLGRFFIESEFRPGQSAVAVVSYGLWQRAFRSRPEIIGSKVDLDGRQTTIVGVAAPDFVPAGAGELWIPKSGAP